MGSINHGIGDLFPVTVMDFCSLDLVFSGVGLLRKLCPVATSEHHISSVNPVAGCGAEW